MGRGRPARTAAPTRTTPTTRCNDVARGRVASIASAVLARGAARRRVASAAAGQIKSQVPCRPHPTQRRSAHRPISRFEPFWQFRMQCRRSMGKKRERQSHLKTDQRTIFLEMGLGGKFQGNQADGTRTEPFSKAMFLKLNTQWPQGANRPGRARHRLRPSTIFRPRSDGVTGYVTSSHGTATPLRYGVSVIWPEISRRPTACACWSRSVVTAPSYPRFAIARRSSSLTSIVNLRTPRRARSRGALIRSAGSPWCSPYVDRMVDANPSQGVNGPSGPYGPVGHGGSSRLPPAASALPRTVWVGIALRDLSGKIAHPAGPQGRNSAGRGRRCRK
jgi:hypothetical protein